MTSTMIYNKLLEWMTRLLGTPIHNYIWLICSLVLGEPGTCLFHLWCSCHEMGSSDDLLVSLLETLNLVLHIKWWGNLESSNFPRRELYMTTCTCSEFSSILEQGWPAFIGECKASYLSWAWKICFHSHGWNAFERTLHMTVTQVCLVVCNVHNYICTRA